MGAQHCLNICMIDEGVDGALAGAADMASGASGVSQDVDACPDMTQCRAGTCAEAFGARREVQGYGH